MHSDLPASIRRVRVLMIAIGAAGALTSGVAHAQVPGEPGAEAKRINDATLVLANVTSATGNPIPRAMLQTAEAIVVFPYAEQGTRARGQGPNQVRNAARTGIRARGILSVRDDAGTWSTGHLPRHHTPQICVDDAPEYLPAHVRRIAVRPYTAPAAHDRGLSALLDELRPAKTK